VNADESNAWETFIDEGTKYLKTAVNGSAKRKDIFTPEILYNIAAMSIEKHIMGYLFYHHKLPENHTLKDLADAMAENSDISATLCEKLAYMDSFQEICSPDTYCRRIPDEINISGILEIGKEVKEFVYARLPLSSSRLKHGAVC
jgi:hypothetical protein